MTLQGFNYLKTKFDFSIDENYYTFTCLEHHGEDFLKIISEEGQETEFLCLDGPQVYEFPIQKLRIQAILNDICEAPKDEINVPY